MKWREEERRLSQLKSILSAYSSGELGILGIGIVIATLTFFLPLTFNNTYASTVLRTLAIAQASVLAIVFSVTLLGVQLVADQYSPKMTSLITSADVFLYTFMLFITSIAIDLVVLYNLPVFSAKVGFAGLILCVAFALSSISSLNRFVDFVVQRSTPEGLLRAYDDWMTVERYRRRVIESKNDTNSLHPFHDLHQLVMAAVSNREWTIASNGIEHFDSISNRIIKSESERININLTNIKDDYGRDYFDELFDNYLPRIARTAVELEEDDIARSTVNTASKIGVSGIRNHKGFIASQAASSLTTMFREAPEGKDGDSLRNTCLESFWGLLVKLAKKPDPQYFPTILSLYSGRFRTALQRDREEYVYRHELIQFYQQGVGKSMESLLNYYGEFASDLDIDWRRGIHREEYLNYSPIQSLSKLREEVCEVTIYILSYVERNERWPILKTRLRDELITLCKLGINSDVEEYGRVLCQCYIDVGYLLFLLGEGQTDVWASRLARAKGEVENPEVINQAINGLKEKGMISNFEVYRNELQKRQKPDSKAQSFYHSIMNEQHSYEYWLIEFEEKLEEMYQENYSG